MGQPPTASDISLLQGTELTIKVFNKDITQKYVAQLEFWEVRDLSRDVLFDEVRVLLKIIGLILGRQGIAVSSYLAVSSA